MCLAKGSGAKEQHKLQIDRKKNYRLSMATKFLLNENIKYEYKKNALISNPIWKSFNGLICGKH